MSVRARPLAGLAVLAALTLALGPGAQAAPPDAAKPAVITLIAEDFSFDAPDRMPPGAVTIRLVNRGQELHHAQLVQLKQGKTPEDLAVAAADGTVPDWAVFVGGPGLVAPGMESVTTVDLRPGTYYWLCFVEAGTEPEPHAAKGMVRRVEVEPGPREPLPEADNTLMLDDYSFKLGHPLEAGRQVIRVRNYAAQPHEVMLIKLMPGKTMDDLLAWMAAGEEDDPPGVPMGGMQALSQGLAGNLIVDLEPGDYGLICFVPDTGDAEPHFVHGMVDQFTIE